MAGRDDRGQAYTLESLIAALLLLTAVLFSLQAVVLEPDSAGSLDRDEQTQRYVQASDALATAENDGELSRLARFWECGPSPVTGEDDAFARDPGGAGNWTSQTGYENNTAPVQDVGEVLNHTFDAGIRYNLELAYQNGTDRGTSHVVYQGTPGDEVVTATYRVVLTEDQRVTGPGVGDQRLVDCESDAPIPNEGDGSIYNVVEVRLVLW